MQLILPEEVISLAFSLEDPISSNLVRSARIQIAQLRYIRPAFGDAMYQKMRAGDYDQFVDDYIKPALAHYVRYEMTGELAVRAGEYGVVRPSSEQSIQISSSTKNDQQNKNYDIKERLNRVENAQKDVSDTSTQNGTSSSDTTKASDEVLFSEDVKLHTISDLESVRGTGTYNNLEYTVSVEDTTLTEHGSVDSVSTATETTERTNDTHEGATSLGSFDSVSGIQSQSGTDTSSVTDSAEMIDTTIKSDTGTTTLKSENSGVGNTERSNFSAATTAEWQMLARHSLRDANVFLRYAIEYVESNVDQFPDYAPMSALDSSIACRRCIGGIVL